MACETQQSFGASPNQLLHSGVLPEADVSRSILRSILLTGIFSAALAPIARPQANSRAPAAGTPPNASTPPESAPATPPPPSTPARVAAPHVSVSPLEGALDLLRDGRLTEAADAYNKIIASGADVPAGYAGLARVNLKEKNVSDAYTAAAKAVELDPKFSDGHVALGEVYFRQGKLADAEKEWISVVNSGHATARAYYGLYRISHATSNFKSAKARIDRAHQLNPDDPDIWRAWAFALGREQRLKELQDFMAAHRIEADANEREGMTHYITMLEDESKRSLQTCTLATKADSTETNLAQLMDDPERLRAFGIEVKLNGQSSHLMIDTGSGGIIIDRRVAEKAGVTHIVDTKTGGIGDKGDVAGYVGYVKSIQVGGLEFHDCYIDVYGKRLMKGDDGLIGTDVFSSFLVDLDFPSGKLRLSQLPVDPSAAAAPVALQSQRTETAVWHDRFIAPEMKSYNPLFRFGHLLLIPTSLNDSPTKLFLIDTGAWDNTVTTSFARETSKVRREEDAHVTGLSGEVKHVYTVDRAKIRFGHFVQDRQDLISFDLTPISNSAGTEISGILGFRLLWQLDIKLDYRDGLVDFTYDPKRFH
jgi:Flp pilus assembly protein TadD/predicted aspartyl protease